MTKRITEVSAADEAKVVDLICHEIDNARDRITSEASWARLEQFFFEKLALCDAIWTTQIVLWGDAGHPAADRAARRFAFEMKERGRGDELLQQLKAYADRVLIRPFVAFPQGRHVVQNFMRNIWIHAVVLRVAEGTGLTPTRKGSTTTPSAAYFVSRGLKRRRFHVSEREVNRIFWNRNGAAVELEASMPRTLSAV